MICMDIQKAMSAADGLDAYQNDAINQMKNGCILCGGVGSGKSRTALGYYYKDFEQIRERSGHEMPLIIITTAKKRDTGEWQEECRLFGIPFTGNLIVDSWNNIGKYVGEIGAFFIFDEQRVVGSGAWVKSFLKIVRANRWILLSATPGDTWKDYIPVFIANGFYKNRTEFTREHIVYSQFTNFPKIDRYLETAKLMRLRDSILVRMDYVKHTKDRHEDIWCQYDIPGYRSIMRNMWNPWTDEPIDTAGALCYALRRICYSDKSRLEALQKLLGIHPKAIIFYNYDFELDLLRVFCTEHGIVWGECNGHRHDEVPMGDRWVYLVNFQSGAEGWNCIATDTLIFYSENYSYRIMQQAAGRIDRRNTPFDILYYYHLKSHSSIELTIMRTLRDKKDFNEGGFYRKIAGSREKHGS